MYRSCIAAFLSSEIILGSTLLRCLKNSVSSIRLIGGPLWGVVDIIWFQTSVKYYADSSQ